MVFQWREGSRWRGKAQEVGETLDRIRYLNDGKLTPELVVATAASLGKGALHSNFEWNDARAADAHRLTQARSLIADVMVIYTEEVEGAPKEPMRAYSSVSSAGSAPAYVSTLEAVSSPALRAVVLSNAKKELEGWRRRYRHYQELAAAVQKVDEALTTVAA